MIGDNNELLIKIINKMRYIRNDLELLENNNDLVNIEDIKKYLKNEYKNYQSMRNDIYKVMGI